MATVEINLAKALKLKNRLAGRLAKVSQDIKTYNCTQEGSEQHDVLGYYESRRALVARLLDLKLALSAANAPIQRAIYELAEAKSLIALLMGLDVRHGKVAQGYPQVEVTLVAQLRKADVDREVQRLEAEVDRLQDRIDSFNHTTKISVDGETLALAGGDKPRGG